MEHAVETKCRRKQSLVTSALIPCMVVIVALCASASAWAHSSGGGGSSTKTWTGNTSTDWGDATNWNNGVPGDYDDVVIPGGRPNYPVLTTSRRCDDLTIQSGGSMSVNGGLFRSDNFDIKAGGTLTFDGGSWEFVGSPEDCEVEGTLNFSGSGTFTTPEGIEVESSTGRLNITGGTFDLGGDLVFESWTQGTISNASMTIDGDVLLNSNSSLSITDSTLDIDDSLTAKSWTTLTVSGGSLSIDSSFHLESSSSSATLSHCAINVRSKFKSSSQGPLAITNVAMIVGSDVDLLQHSKTVWNGGSLAVDGDIDLSSHAESTMTDMTIEIDDELELDTHSKLTQVLVTMEIDGDTSSNYQNHHHWQHHHHGNGHGHGHHNHHGHHHRNDHDAEIDPHAEWRMTDSFLTVGNDLDVREHGYVKMLRTDVYIDDDLEIGNHGTYEHCSGELVIGDELDMKQHAIFDLCNGGSLCFEGDFTLTFDLDIGSGKLCVHGDFTIASGKTLSANNGEVEVGGDISVLGNWSLAGTTTLTLSGDGDVTVDAPGATLYAGSLVIAKENGGSATFDQHIFLLGALTLSEGTLDTGNHDVTTGGSVVIAASADLELGTGELTMNGSGDRLLDANGAGITSLNIDGSGKVCIVSPVTVLGAVHVDAGVTLCIEDGGLLDLESASPNSFVVEGTLVVQAGGAIEMESGSQLLISGGNLLLIGDSASSVQTAATISAESGGFKVLLQGSSSMNAAGAIISGGVFDLEASVVSYAFRRVNFTGLPAGYDDAYIDLRGVTTGNAVVREVSFVRGSLVGIAAARNIIADTTTAEVMISGYTGNLSGEEYDNDPANKVRWINNSGSIPVETSSGTQSIDSLLDVNTVLPGPTEDTYVDRFYTATVAGATIEVPVFAEVRGKLVVNDFAGTLHINGFTFRGTTSDAVLIDATAVVSGGVINLYNCIFIDAVSSGDRALFVPGGATINLKLCTVDSSQAMAGMNGSVSDCIFARNSGFDKNIFIDYDVNVTGNYRERNMRLKSLNSDITGASPSALFPLDVDSKPRPNPTSKGAHHFEGTRKVKLQITDISSSIPGSRNAAIVFESRQTYNSSPQTSYVSGSDGENCYIALVNHTTVSVGDTVSFAGSRCGSVSFIQTSDISTRYWLLVSYDTSGDGYFDTVKRLMHDRVTGDITDMGDMTVRDQWGNSTVDFNSEGGWNGFLSLQTSAITGSPGVQVSLVSQNSGGEIHNYYFNNHSTDGYFYSSMAFTGNAGDAAESYLTGVTPGLTEVGLNPNPAAPPILFGTTSSGRMVVTRFADAASPASLLQIDRGGSNHTILNTFVGPGLGHSLSVSPLITFNANNRRVLTYTDQSKITMFDPITWSGIQTLDIGLAGYGSPMGIDGASFYLGGSAFFPLYNPESGLGAVAAVEYNYSQNGGTAFELLGDTYSDARVRYNAGGTGFVNGLAHVVGTPTRIYQLPAQRSLFCATDAGFVYAWQTGFIMTSETTAPKGAMIEGYPFEVPGGRVSGLGGANVTSPALKSDLGMTSNGPALLIFTDTGQILMARVI